KRFNRPIASNLLRILKSPELAEEVLQDVFLMLWERRKDVDPEKSIGAFLFRAAVNRTKNVFRSLKYDAKMRQIVFQAMLEQQAELANDWLEQKETKAFIHQLLLQLPEQQRKVYTLCKLEGRSYKEVS